MAGWQHSAYFLLLSHGSVIFPAGFGKPLANWV